MPQLQLPMFPAGVTEINTRVAVEAKDGRVCYIHGHLPVFQHDEKDVWSFRMFTSQMIVNGTDGEAERNRPDIWCADGHGQEIHESVSGTWSERFL